MPSLDTYIKYQKPQGKYNPNWEARLGEAVAQGSTKEEATDNLFKDVKKSLHGSYIPTLIFHKNRVALIFRELQGWSYHIRKLEENGKGLSCVFMDGDDRVHERAARKHLADYAYDDGYPIEEAGSIIIDEKDFANWKENIERSSKVQAIMAERNVDSYQASMILDGLVK